MKMYAQLVMSLLAIGVAGPSAAQQPGPIAGVWSLSETRTCNSGPAWVFFADGFYAEIQLPDSNPSAVGIWRDEGEAIAYTHTHMPFAGHERPMRVRHLTVEERTSERLTTRNYRGIERVFHRCPSESLNSVTADSRH